MNRQLLALAQQVGQLLMTQQAQLVTAESCTGGWVAETLTAIPGSSAWFDRGFVTYSNLAKQEMLGVRADTLQQYGAVSAETAKAMVEGALRSSHAQLALAVTGIAGPEGGTLTKPVGTVWFAWAGQSFSPLAVVQHFSGDREMVRQQAVEFVLKELISLISS